MPLLNSLTEIFWGGEKKSREHLQICKVSSEEHTNFAEDPILKSVKQEKKVSLG